MDPPPTINDGPIHSRWNHGMSKGGLTIHWADIGNESTVRNTTSEMRWWRTNSFGGGEKDSEWNGSLFLGRKGLEDRVVCGVWERRREGEGEEEEREKRKGKDLSLFQSISSPAGLIPHGTLQTLSNHSPNTLPLKPYPSNPDPKMGDPHLLPTRGKGGKRGGKGHFLHILSSIFLSGGEPPDPPF